ncbi:MAG TPA: hypothetical protein EYN66_01900 [Myxococcales bacterium]|nr:hypothetical protein [Myxococcales bacterium]
MQFVWVIGVGLVLALLGVTEGSDGIIHWVYGIVDSISYTDIWRPLYNPEPMDTYAYRPLSVVMLKLGLWATGRSVLALTVIHSLALVAFGLVGRRFLIHHGFSKGVATLSSLTAMAMPSVLFSAWLNVEFDLVGAVFVLAAANSLCTYEKAVSAHTPTRKSLIIFWIFAFLAMTTKETSALQLLAYLVAFTYLRRSERSYLKLTAGYLAGLIVVTLPMHFVDSGNTHAFTLWSDGFHPVRVLGMLFHTGSQLLYLVSHMGAAFLAVAAIRQLKVDPQRGNQAAIILIGVCCAFAPVMVSYSHFEAVVFSHWWWALFGMLLLVAGVSILAFRGETRERTALLMVLLTLIGYTAAPIVLRFARADVSARIFAACLPVLHAVIWRALFQMWSPNRGVVRVFGGLAIGIFALFTVSSAFNAVSFHRSRLPAEDAAKTVLAQSFKMTCPAIINTNAVQWLSMEDLRTRGARLGQCAWIQTTSSNPSGDMDLRQFAATGAVVADKGQDTYLYLATARTRMDAHTNAQLLGSGVRSRK